MTDARSPQLPKIAADRLTFDGARWIRDGFAENGRLVDSVWWRIGETPVVPRATTPSRAEIYLSDGDSRGRNSWFRAPLAKVCPRTIHGLPEITLDVHSRREARLAPISVGLSRKDAEALGWALIAIATPRTVTDIVG